MAFTQANLSLLNLTGAGATQQNMWYYVVPGADDIAAAHYFASTYPKMKVGDLIFASDGKLRYVATATSTSVMTTAAVNA